jgi:hypothetical protein
VFYPVDGARVTSDYQGGFRSTGGHSGIDFGAPKGSPIRAVAGGRVLSVGWGGKYGNLVTVQHDDGSVGYYAHLHQFGVQMNQRIDVGSYIGQVGSTGNSTGPHLHFEVRQNGSPVNPMPWLTNASQGPGQTPSGDLYSLPPGENTYSTVERDNADLLAALEATEAPRMAMSTPGGGFLPAAGGVLTDSIGSQQLDNNPLALETMLGEEARFDQRVPAGFDMAQLQATAPVSSTWTQPALYAPTGNPAGSGNPFDRLRNAIAAKESGGNYSAVNPTSGALGKYQIIPGNIASWSKAALGYSITPQQFLRDPSVQDRIATYQLGQYYNKYGAAGAALAWYAGEGALSYSSAARNRPQGAYPSMNSYVQDVLRRAGL